MNALARLFMLIAAGLCFAGSVHAQLPFYTDDPAVTDAWKFHFEFFNEYDALQFAQFPDLRQNTANFRLNYGLPHHLEFDVDAPYLEISRSSMAKNSAGFGDTDMGIKWNFRPVVEDSRSLGMGVSFYFEVPTGNVHQQLGSGLADYWLNFIVQKPFSNTTRLTTNIGFLFAGNTSTGVLGTLNTRGHVFTSGLSLLHDFSSRLTLGGEVYAAVANNDQLGKTQLQGMAGGQYQLRNGLGLAFGLLGGKYIASPRVGFQVGFALDFPDVFRSQNGVHSQIGESTNFKQGELR